MVWNNPSFLRRQEPLRLGGDTFTFAHTTTDNWSDQRHYSGQSKYKRSQNGPKWHESKK